MESNNPTHRKKVRKGGTGALSSPKSNVLRTRLLSLCNDRDALLHEVLTDIHHYDKFRIDATLGAEILKVLTPESIGVNFSQGQQNAKSDLLNFLISRAPQHRQLWRGPNVSAPSPLLLLGVSGTGKSTLASALWKNGFLIMDADEVISYIYRKVNNCDSPGKKDLNWYSHTLEQLEAGDTRYCAQGSKVLGMLSALRVGSTSHLARPAVYDGFGTTQQCHGIIINPLLEGWGPYDGYERYILACIGRASASSLIGPERGLLHLKKKADILAQISKKKRELQSFVMVPAYSSSDDTLKTISKYYAATLPKAFSFKVPFSTGYKNAWLNTSD